MNIWEKMQKVDRRVLYAILIVLCCVGLFFPATIPTDPDPSSKAFYTALNAVPTDKTIIIQSDWTNSTRGESMGHFENLLRILMSRGYKFVFYSAADPIAPQVARTVVTRINNERREAGLRVYKLGEDYLDLGFFANAEATNTNMGVDLRRAWTGRRTKTPTGQEKDIFDTPVLRDVRRIEDAGMMVVVTASASIDVAVQRLSQRLPMTAMVTGVVGPTVLPFFQANQLRGVVVGLKGVYDTEYMMNFGINVPDATGRVQVEYLGSPEQVPPITEGKTFARGRQYYGTLHVALLLLILAVVLGNVGMFLSRRKRGSD